LLAHIRVADPFGLAERVLDDPTRWGRRALEDANGSGRTQVIPIARPVPVLVDFW
jgi:murein L,D-transpeptidase YcbB/YkuD